MSNHDNEDTQANVSEVAKMSDENDLGLKLAAENKRLKDELAQREQRLTTLADAYDSLDKHCAVLVKERDDLANQGPSSRATHADSFTQGVAYALQAARSCSDLETLQGFLVAVLADARALLVSIDQAENALASRLANGIPPQGAK